MPNRIVFSLTLIVAILVCRIVIGNALAESPVSGRQNRLGPAEIAIIVNAADPLSMKVGRYYQKKRHIPPENIITVHFKPGISTMGRKTFERIKSMVDTVTPSDIQAYVLTWAAPYRVGCMSITAAFADGYDETYCTKPCGATKYNPYFNTMSIAPYKDYGLRPTMMLAGLDFQSVKKLIDRGVQSDSTFPSGRGYLLSTTDKARNVRAAFYPNIVSRLGRMVRLEIMRVDFLEGEDDVLFYFTGIDRVAGLDTIRFIPGAIADHLTSAGGQLTNSKQMSSLRWLEAGATGSYGAVVEPCNISAKFPHPGVVISHYLRGETLIEAYWKSVAMPGQGVFIGEPLAAPYGPRKRGAMRRH